MPPLAADSSVPFAATLLLDSPAEEAFDRFTRLVAQILHVPVALVSILDTKRQFFKSACGLPEPVATSRETPLSHSFCQYVVKSAMPLIVDDARNHPKLKKNLAVKDLGVVGYAGFPLYDAGGQPLGALCAIDDKPRAWTPRELEILQTLATQVSSEVALREQTTQLGLDLAALRSQEQERASMNRSDRHDLRTPLNAVHLNLQAVAEFGPLNDEQEEYLAAAKRNLHAVLEMVDRLIDIGTSDGRGPEALQVDSHEVESLIHAALDQVAALAVAKQIELSFDCPASAHLSVDQDKLVRVLVNLLANGIKFTPGPGEVHLSARHAGADGATAFQFTIRDTGIGLAPQHLDRIFEEGYRVDPNAPLRRSTGLGLTFCQRIVQAHQGKIWVESIPGAGSAFHFTIPLKVD